jgi:hypothetical protein
MHKDGEVVGCLPAGGWVATVGAEEACTLRNNCWQETYESDLFCTCEHTENVFETSSNGTTTHTEETVYGVDPGDTAVGCFAQYCPTIRSDALSRGDVR